MKISGTIRLACPACGQPADVPVTQSINAREHPAQKAALLDGTLNRFTCDRCGHTAALEATLSYHDPAHAYFAVVAPREDKAGEAALAAIEGTRRLVPSRNALVEKIKILDAGLDDRVVEVLKVLLLASRGHELDTVLLFDTLDRAAGTIGWILLDKGQQPLASPLGGYEKLAATLKAAEDLRIDRLWAVEAARTMMSNAN